MRRFAFTPAWLAWHVLMVAAVVTCLWLGDWQWVRALDTGSLQNFAYAVQWPFFALFFAGMWWRMMRLESRKLDEQEAARDSARAEAEPAEQAAAEAEPAEQPAAGQASVERASEEPTTGAQQTDRSTAEPLGEKPARAAEEPAAPSSAAEAARDAGDPEDPEDAQLAAYNRMLAALAAQDEAGSARR